MQHKCNRFLDSYCLKTNATKCCSKCKIVYYCSKNCQKKDWLIHKLVCYPNLSDRLKGMSQFSIKYNVHVLNFSGGNYQTVNNIIYSISAFRVQGTVECGCVICEKKIVFKDQKKYLTSKIHYDDNNNNTYIIYHFYYKCQKCYDENRVLCNQHFIDINQCHINNSKKIELLLFYINYIYIYNDVENVRDITNIIILMIYKMIECK
jgi:hypothetical protein